MAYRDISRGPQLKKAYDEYQAWLDKTPEQRKALYNTAKHGNRFVYAKQTIYVPVFGQTNRTLFVKAKGPADAATTPASEVRGVLIPDFAAKDLPNATGTVILENEVFPVSKLAKLILTKREATDNTPRDRTSRITGRVYKQYKINSASMPFGKSTALNSYSLVVNALRAKAEIKTYFDTAGSTVQFIPEG